LAVVQAVRLTGRVSRDDLGPRRWAAISVDVVEPASSARGLLLDVRLGRLIPEVGGALWLRADNGSHFGTAIVLAAYYEFRSVNA